MGTVEKRKLPASYKVQKVNGTTFHLPLPIEETLNRLPDPQQALPDHGELILMRSVPTKSNINWQDLVDVQKMYNALLKLKEINPLYVMIQLPGAPEDLDVGKESYFPNQEMQWYKKLVSTKRGHTMSSILLIHCMP